ncbi:phage integrase SAM-like domain-containing protein, partial [Bacteroides heparinolyticus]|uniref:phage integrase SAM-like domain-containing protein n=1 Tax=Prevotella heparinolytica TaxID=28113 RepID=UPI003FA18B67
MFSILSYFRRADGLRRVSPISKKEKEKKVRNVIKERNAVPTLSCFVRVAAGGLSRSTAENYRTAVRSFVRFNGGRDVPLSALDAETLRRYERW